MSTLNLAKLGYLAVDDDANTRQILNLLLSKTIGSQQVIILESSEVFQQVLAEMPFAPDVILLDIAVKPFNGYQMLEFIRQEPAFTKTKVVAITAHVMHEEVERIKAAGFNGMISKPFIRQIFAELMHRLMAGEPVWYIA
jgi:CheY-like chemotaxis protein